MVEMPPSPRKLGHGPVITCEDESENAIFGARSPSLPDILDLSSKTSKPKSDVANSLSQESSEAVVGPRVTFRTPSESDTESLTSQKSIVTQQQTQQQNLDFELDVAVDIDSGKCVFYPADDGEREETSDSK